MARTRTAPHDIPMLGQGIYTMQEAVKLVGVPASQIRRWVAGYRCKRDDERHVVAPLWTRDFEDEDGATVLNFLDLLMVRFVHQLREKDEMEWPRIRRLIKKAEKRLGVTHPFCSRRFATDGRTLYEEVVKEESGMSESLEDLDKDQLTFPDIVKPCTKDLEFGDIDGMALRWWPMGRSSRVVIDPTRSRGAPVAVTCGIRTAVLDGAVRAEKRHGGYSRDQAVARVARWFRVDNRDVLDAYLFERKLAAA